MGELILNGPVRQAPTPRIWSWKLSFPKIKSAHMGDADPTRKEYGVRLGPGFTISPTKPLKWFIS
jgi:hypothetical protein